MSVETAFTLEYKICDDKIKEAMPVVIVAGGSSSRMKGIDKISAEILGIPVIARTLLAFERNKYISEIVVVTKENNIPYVKSICDRYMITKLSCVCAGGKNRCLSVLNGLKRLHSSTKNVLIHDGARPLVSDELINRVVLADIKYPCVLCGVPIVDTVKEIKDSLVVKNINRDDMTSVQTPQRLDYSIYLPLLESTTNYESYTDDSSFMEKAGYDVFVVNGEKRNIKITTALDLLIARAILEDEVL